MSIVPIPLFWIEVPIVSKDIGLHAKGSRVKADKKVELAEELQPVCLLAGEEF